MAERLDAVADWIEGTASGPLPDLRAPFADLADVVESSLGHAVSSEVAAQVHGRLALYGALVPRVERLAAPDPAVRQHQGMD